MIGSILSRAAEVYGADRDRLSYIVHSGDRTSIELYRSDTPVGVCRFSRTNDGTTEREYARLREANHVVSDNERLQSTIESPVSLAEIRDTTVLFTVFQHGTPGHVVLRGEVVPVGSYLRACTDWLIDFARASHEVHRHDPARKRAALDEWIVEVDAQYVDVIAENDDLFIAPVHMDFTSSNIFLSGQGNVSGVIDFEFFSTMGVPWWDVFSVVSDAAVTRGGWNAESLAALYFSDTSLSRAAGRSVRQFCGALDTDFDAVVSCLPIFWSHLEANRPEFDETLLAWLLDRTGDVIW